MITVSDSLRQASLKNLWLHNQNWVQLAEEGGPRFWREGQGVRLYDSDGNSFIDLKSGYASVNVGHGRPEIADAAYEQILKTGHHPCGTTTIPAVKLAEKVSSITPGTLSRVFFVSGGSEATETSVKIARAYHQRRGEPGRYKVISRFGSYHGATGAAQWMGGISGMPVADFEPAYPGMVHGPQPSHYRCDRRCKTPAQCAVHYAQAIEDLILFHNSETIAAFIGEPISDSCGVQVPGDEYWPRIREMCDRYGILLIADEVICGFGRTGKMFGLEHWGIVPDIMAVAKGMVSCYMTIGASVATTKVAEVFGGDENFFKHSLTFSGHPAAAAAALKNIEIIEDENLANNAASVGAYLREQLEGLKQDHPTVADVRGLGLINAVEVVSDRETRAMFPPDVAFPYRMGDLMLKNGLLPTAGYSTISIAPPLCLTRSEADEIADALDLSLGEFESERGIVN